MRQTFKVVYKHRSFDGKYACCVGAKNEKDAEEKFVEQKPDMAVISVVKEKCHD